MIASILYSSSLCIAERLLCLRIYISYALNLGCNSTYEQYTCSLLTLVPFFYLLVMDFTVFLCFFLLSISRVSPAKDTLIPGQSLKDHDTLVSADGSFELGFFSPNNSKNRYLGIWYKQIPGRTVVWVANRDTPLFNSSGVLLVDQLGFIILLNSTNSTIWSSNSSMVVQNPVAQLLDSGNFLVNDGKSIIWQSFDHPHDTLLPGMKLGWDLDRGVNRILSSWKTKDDPSQGGYSCFVDLRGFPQLFIVKGNAVETRCGLWNGMYFAGSPQLKTDSVFEYSYVSNHHELYYSYVLKNSSVISRLVMSEKGVLERHIWIEKTQSWLLFFSVPTDQCDSYALCGPYAFCNINSTPLCACLDGFVPKSPSDWSLSDWSDGCVRRTPLSCHDGDGFWKHSGMQLPDTSSAWVDKSIGLKECEKLCLRNCSCVAYTNSDIRGSGCLLWFNNLVDMRVYPDAGEDLYVRMAASELEKKKLRLRTKVAIIVTCLFLAIGILALGLFLHMRKQKSLDQRLIQQTEGERDSSGEKEVDLPFFNLTTIITATDDFAIYNKLGEGGFGPVYKGVLPDGREIAVKRLSEASRQGSQEFRNEVLMIAKLQHRNLVKLLGSCIQGEEKMLVYEYLLNQSLDSFIFDETKSNLVDWETRFNIISGVAKGLLYLHEDSRLRIIHRDLKASNVLLDVDMNAKISDFGLARIFSKDQTTANTKRVVGTYGYMAPEYAVDGHFSVKSDVFSFGVLVLEIVSGERNRGFFHPDHGHNLLGHAWRLWMEEKELEMVDNSIKNRCNENQVRRCIHVGLLCVQRLREDRPEMSGVLVMLGSECLLPEPKQPGFYTERNPSDFDSSSSKEAIWSRNDITSTSMGPR